jgi:hypothetical protein
MLVWMHVMSKQEQIDAWRNLALRYREAYEDVYYEYGNSSYRNAGAEAAEEILRRLDSQR